MMMMMMMMMIMMMMMMKMMMMIESMFSIKRKLRPGYTLRLDFPPPPLLLILMQCNNLICNNPMQECNCNAIH